MPLQLGEEHHAFTKWSIDRGVQINGIEPLAMPGQGVGIYAARDIQAQETVLTVPLAAMLTIDSMPGSFVKLFPEDAPVQGVMAAYLIHGSGVVKGDSPVVKDEGDAAGHGEESGSHHELELWKKVLPSRSAILESMPLAWDEGLKTVPSQARASKDDQTIGASPEHVSTKKRKIAEHTTTDGLQLPPCLSGHWPTVEPDNLSHPYARSKHQNILSQQKARLLRAWEIVSVTLPTTRWEDFLYYWLIINTRCFYYDGNLVGHSDARSHGKPSDDNDAIAMMPFADYFNHNSDRGCKACFDGLEYTFVTTKPHEKGEEIFVSYGDHPNDFLWAEYGFFLDENPSDLLYLDDIILQDLKEEELDDLDQFQYLGNYQLFPSEVCYRTEMAACRTYMSSVDWSNYASGLSSRGVDDSRTAKAVWRWIGKYIQESELALEELRTELEDTGNAVNPVLAQMSGWRDKVALCIKRWNQIKVLCEQTLKEYS